MERYLVLMILIIFSTTTINAKVDCGYINKVKNTNFISGFKNNTPLRGSDPIIKNKRLVKLNEVPTQVKTVTKSGEYKGWVIYEAYKVELANGNITYELYLQQGFKTIHVNLDKVGRRIGAR